jgi:aryl-alcohol dehydrogenase-like predicted oxidoreductase
MFVGGPTDETTATRIVAAAEDAGVNFVDTADAYDIGCSQDIVGRAIARDRERWALAATPVIRIPPIPWKGGSFPASTPQKPPRNPVHR